MTDPRNLGGRPAVGEPINVRLGDDLLARVDAAANDSGVSRAEQVRELVTSGLNDRLIYVMVQPTGDKTLQHAFVFAAPHSEQERLEGMAARVAGTTRRWYYITSQHAYGLARDQAHVFYHDPAIDFLDGPPAYVLAACARQTVADLDASAEVIYADWYERLEIADSA